jgi:AmmeMemoRadiSam system protein B
MSQTLPRLRMDLDFMPSPLPDRPGLLIRDPFHYSDATLIFPAGLIECLQLFDGNSTDLDLRSALVQLTGDLQVGELQRQLLSALSEAGFLQDDNYGRMKRERHARFADAPLREPVHAGGAYPAEAAALRATLAGWMDGAARTVPADSLAGIAAPHVSPEGGLESYRAAYSALAPQLKDRVFVVLGTSHYGEAERFGLTRKPFATPLGTAETDCEMVERLAADAGPAAKMEDYCHAVEHSIEFQVVFLQHVFGPKIRILPLLCGAFARSVQAGGLPEDDDNVRRFLGALGDLAAREGDRLFWVLGIDMAHMGRRYGDPFSATAGEGRMAAIRELDHSRIRLLADADAAGFWAAVQQDQDALKWCGAAPLYTFLRSVPGAKGELLHYQQWNIDDHSVVTFGALAFRRQA